MITLKITEREKELLIKAISECSFNIADSWCGENLETGELEYNIPSNDQKDIDDLDKLEDKIMKRQI
jgi:hypothetical protein